MMGENREALDRYSECMEIFGPDDDIILGFPLDTFGPETFVQAFETRQIIKTLPGVRAVIDLATAGSVETREDLDLLMERPRRLERLKTTIRANSLFKGLFLAPDEKAHLVLVRTEDLPQREKQVLVRRLRAGLDEKFGVGVVRMSGYPVFAERYVTLLMRENAFFLHLSIAVSALLAWLLFGSLLIALVTATTIFLPAVWTQGFYALLGYKLNLFSALLTPITILVGLSFSIQFMTRYHRWIAHSTPEERAQGKPVTQAVEETMPPSLLCAATTIIGFASQIFSGVQGIRAFGILSSLGCCFAFFSTFLLLPGFLHALDLRLTLKSRQFLFERPVNRFLARAQGSPVMVILSIFILTVGVCLGLQHLRIGADPITAFPAADPVVEAHQFIDTHFGGGTRRISLIARANSGRFDLFESMDTLRRIEICLASDPAVISVFSPASLIANIEVELSSGTMPFPASDEEISRSLRLAENLAPEVLKTYLNTPYYDRAQIVVALKVSDSVRVEAASWRLEKMCETINPGVITASATGRMLLSAQVENQAIRMEMASFGSSLWIILMLIGLGFRSVRAFFIALLANVFPILMSLGVMGWMGTPLEPATGMAPCICIGIIVDDTIHLLYETFLEENKGHNAARVRTTILLKMGWAVISASLILMCGMGILCFSKFGPIRHFGTYSLISMAFGLLFELFLTPALLTLTRPKK